LTRDVGPAILRGHRTRRDHRPHRRSIPLISNPNTPPTPRVLPRVPTYDHTWYWRARLPERKGQPCRVLARGSMNSILVEFADGFRAITSRYAVRRTPAPLP
jgi:hypothetical protein